MKINSNSVKCENMKNKTLEVLEENVSEYLLFHSKERYLNQETMI